MVSAPIHVSWPMLTYVTAFHPLRQSAYSYFMSFQPLAESGVPILLFTDAPLTLPYPNVRVIRAPFDRSSLPKDAILPTNRGEKKDTVAFLWLMLLKLYYVKEALKYTDSSYIAWIDFRVFHVVRDTKKVQDKLVSLVHHPFTNTKILAPGCWSPNPSFDIFNAICWRFCGGFFLGPREILEAAYEKQMELVEKHLPRLTWEVNYWTLMEEFFEWYSGDHNDSLLMNVPHT